MAPEAGGLLILGFLLMALTHGVYAPLAARSRRQMAAPPGGAGMRPPHARPGAQWLFPAALAVSALWGLAGWLDLHSTKRWTTHLALLLDQTRLALWCAFLAGMVQPALAAASAQRRAPGWGRLLLGGLVLLSLASNLVAGVLPAATRGLAHLLAWVQLAWGVLGLLLVEQLWRNQEDRTRWGVKPLCLALGLIFVFDIYLYAQVLMFGALDVDTAEARPLVHTLALPLLVLAARRQHGAIAALKVSSAAAFYSASLLLVGLYLMLVAAAGYYVRFAGGTWGGALQVSLAFAAAIGLGLLVMSGELRARVRVFVNKHFFRYRYDYRVEWLRFTAMLSSDTAPQEVGERVVRGLADMVEATGGAMWARSAGETMLVQTALWNLPPLQQKEDPASAFCQTMGEREWLFDLTEGRAGHRRPRPPAFAGAEVGGGRSSSLPPPGNDLVPPWLSGIEGAWLIVPLRVGSELFGFVVLKRPRVAVELNWEVRDLLKTAARQAAAFLAQMHATEALLEARKFDAFNRMSAFVVHDLKNIVTQLTLMLKNAQRHRDNPEFQQDMLATVESSLEKMRQMMLQLREGAKPSGSVSGVELAPLLARIAAAAAQHGRYVATEVAEGLATRGQEERLERVLGHLVHNALDATPPQGRVWVKAHKSAGRLQIQVGDSGAGMSAEFIQSRLFRPFNSTKGAGMGIGSYESFQYVKELGGTIDVESEPGRGTVFTLWLPVFELRTGSDLRAAAVQGGGA